MERLWLGEEEMGVMFRRGLDESICGGKTRILFMGTEARGSGEHHVFIL